MRIAQILYDKVHWLPNTTESLAVFRAKFAPNMIFVEVADDAEEGWLWDGEKAVKPVEPQKTLDELKGDTLNRIQSWTRQHIIGGFTSSAKGSPHRYDSEEADQLTFAALYAASKSPDFAEHPIYHGEIPIRAIPDGQTGKVILGHNAAEMQKLSDDLALHIGYCKQIGWDLQDAVAVTQTAEELAAITWPE